MQRLLGISLLLTTVALIGCKPRVYNEKDSSAATLSPVQAISTFDRKKLDSIWEVMRAEHLKNLQPQCEPKRYSPPAGVAPRGVAILLHGFSACPDQYDVWGPRMAALGYEVLIPLFPGHGALPLSLSPRKDDVEFVPRVGAGWGPTRDRINELGMLFSGERVLIGLSQGSNMALGAIQKEPNLWDKAFLVSPKLTNEVAFLKFLLKSPVHILSINQVSDENQIKQDPADYGEQQVLSFGSGWKKCSEIDVFPPGNRGGFCNFENRHAMAMFDFGDMVVKNSRTLAEKGVKIKTQVQFVLSRYDDGVCNDAALEVMKGLQNSGAHATACRMPEGVPHAMFSQHDSPYDKPWNKPLFESADLFFLKSNVVPGSGTTVGDCKLSF